VHIGLQKIQRKSAISLNLRWTGLTPAALIALDESFQMMSNIVGCDFDEIHCDMPVGVLILWRRK
jgi:hypothetical protein